MRTLWKHIPTAWILQCHQKKISLSFSSLFFSRGLSPSLSAHCGTRSLLCLSKIASSIKLQPHTVRQNQRSHYMENPDNFSLKLPGFFEWIASLFSAQKACLIKHLYRACVKYENEEKKCMNGLGEMHSYSGMTGMHSSTKNDSCLLIPQNPCKNAAEAGEILQLQENTHCRYNSIFSNDGLMQVWGVSTRVPCNIEKRHTTAITNYTWFMKFPNMKY